VLDRGEIHGPVGTARKLLARIRAAAPAGAEGDLAWNPEFLREGNAVQDTLRPDRFVYGVTSERAKALLRQVYDQPLAEGIPALAMGLETAELVKVSANAFLATKISFINAVADACEAAGADVTQLVGRWLMTNVSAAGPCRLVLASGVAACPRTCAHSGPRP